ncbi:MOSC N-terminal beta barrel domain-containing protein [Candidatus Parabeggiatoa sp. HSG14]|uniref:MOSC domain-containing protein n=1 Tax=Candidatus Parabeggiatoa sp. HSG14 TaxID=3055593 RepID=UPI0025A8CBE3|nr:MOSC domain-containing protein [Thiotrichales bacterium HSG14]
MPTITHLYRYPVKGLNPEVLQHVSLQAGKTIALDRRFALAHRTTEFNPQAPQHLHKTRFLMLMKNERLAALNTVYDDNTGILQIFKDNNLFANGNLQTTQGRQTIENFFADYLGDEIRDTPKLVQAPGHTFSDVNAEVLSCINLATVRDLEKVLSTTVHPLRFRANVYFDDVQPWAESDWVGKKLMLGTAKVRVLKFIERCAATNVNPHTAERDLKIPQTLLKTYGHRHLGIYVQVIENGEVAVNDELIEESNF